MVTLYPWSSPSGKRAVASVRVPVSAVHVVGVALTTLFHLHVTAFAAFIFQHVTRADKVANDSALMEKTSERNIYDMYDIHEELGAGTYATVRRAVHKSTGEEVAVKIIDKKR